MTDYTELKRLAKAAIIARNEYDADECNAELADEQTAADDAFHDAAGPDEVLALIAENERLISCIVQRRAQAEQYDQALIKMAAERDQLKAENDLLRKLASDTGHELRKASSWICREVEAGTQSATHWAIRLREKADHIDVAVGKGEQS